MWKYIDADRLRKEIERRIEILKKAELDWAKQGDTETSVYYSGKSVALDEFTHFIGSLQQEQPEVDLEKEIDSYFKKWCTDLTDQGYILRTPDGTAGLISVKNIARHFYELGLNARKEE